MGSPVKAERGQLLIVGVSRDPRTMNIQLKRACGVLRREGFRVSIPTPGALIQHGKKLEGEIKSDNQETK